MKKYDKKARDNRGNKEQESEIAPRRAKRTLPDQDAIVSSPKKQKEEHVISGLKSLLSKIEEPGTDNELPMHDDTVTQRRMPIAGFNLTPEGDSTDR